MGSAARSKRLGRSAGYVTIGFAFLAVLGLPFALRPREGPASGGTAARSDLEVRRLVIISPHSETIRHEFGHAFAEWAAETHGFAVEVEWLNVGGTMAALRFVNDRFEARPDGIDVDIFFGGGVDPFLDLLNRGNLHRCRLPDEVLAPIPREHAGTEIYDAQQRWFGACLSGFGILYNKPVLEFLELPEPRTWSDLGRPEYFTWVASADPRQSGSMHMAYEIILQAYGWERGWAEVVRIGANCRAFTRGASDVPADVSTGEAAVGMAIDVYGLAAVGEAGKDRLTFLLPEGLTVVNPDGMGVLRGAPNVELAEQFVEFVLSERGQKLWVLKVGAPGGPRQYPLYRMPVIPGMVQRYGRDAVVHMDPFSFHSGVAFDIEKKNQRWSILNDLLGACIIDVHKELAGAWRDLRHLPESDPRMRQLLEPPVSEEEVMRMAREEWASPAFKARTVASWSRDAARRYKRLAEEK